MKVTIRQIEQKDNASLANMIRTVFEQHNAPKEGTVYTDPTTNNLYELFRTPKSILWVAEVNSKAIGCCGIYPTIGLEKDCVELVKFYLSEDARGKGIGKQLMQKSVESAKELGYNQIYLESLPVFSKAVGMYEKLGFERLVKPLGESGHTTCNIWMLKEI
ncbi:putative acetyltransferase [Tenacibaculum adriaticum]|uniref:Putative acetyltransferase n=1 Tax=Tenacibaculum adriaticum TaxID=413713 RepID=A0A5S5DPR0_9FLAO|nr:GNAT family N-acetyltransferase [Tenacibaculum adriaticum]TYP97923.1 putative acetyltransferase [Tenacibaculum adriaticum]